MKDSDIFYVDPLSITAELGDIGVDQGDIPGIDIMKIKDSEEAYKLLLNTYKTSSKECDRLMLENGNLKKEIVNLKIGNTEKRNSVIVLTIAELITSIGVGGIFTSHVIMSALVIICGLILTAFALYLNFKK